MTVKSSEPFAKDASVDAPSTTTRATAGEEDEVEDAGTTAAPVMGGATGLVRTAGRITLARVPGGVSLMRIVLRATQAFPQCHHHQEGMTTTIKTRGLGAFRSRVLSPAS